jgi:hypothetical protein
MRHLSAYLVLLFICTNFCLKYSYVGCLKYLPVDHMYGQCVGYVVKTLHCPYFSDGLYMFLYLI